MKKSIINFSVRHPISVMMIVTAVVITGIICLFSIRVDFLPAISERHILVVTKYDGIAASEMKKLVTVPIEDSFASLKGIKASSSVTRDGISLVLLELHWGTDIDIALTESHELIDLCFEALPSGCKKPTATVFNPVQKDTITIAVEAHDEDLAYCRYIVDNEIKQRFQRLEGVGSVSVAGGVKEEVRVIIDKAQLEARQLTLQMIADSLTSANFEYPAGMLKDGDKDLLLKTSGLYETLDDIANTPVLYNEGSVLRVNDVGVVEKVFKEKESFFLYDGKECVCIGIKKKQDASPLAISQNVRDELLRLESLYGKHYSFKILSDTSRQISDSVLQLILSAMAGIGITFVLLFIFFKTMRTALLVASIIPLAILFSIIVLMLAARTINILSLSGMTVGIGMVIDTSTVVVENIQKHIAQKKQQIFSQLVVDATGETALSSIGSTITTVVVFVPFFFLPGILGELFSDMAIAVIASVSVSCIFSLTYIPSSMVLLFQRDTSLLTYQKTIIAFEQKYESALRFVFEKKHVAPVIVVICIILGIIPFIELRKEFLPASYVPTVSVDISFPEGMPMQKLQEHTAALLKTISRIDCVDAVFVSGGIDSDNDAPLVNPAKRKESIVLSLNTKDTRRVQDTLRVILDDMGITYSFSQNLDLLSELLSVQNDTYVFTSDDSIQEKAKQFATTVVPDSFVNEHVFLPDRIACARFNVTARSVASLVRDVLEGVDASFYYEKGRRVPISVAFAEDAVTTVQELENVNVMLEHSYVPLKTLGVFYDKTSEKIIYRYNRKDAKLIVGEIADGYEDDADIEWLQGKQLAELFGNATFLLVVVVLLLYCVMGAQFEDFTMPLLVLIALPPAFSGAFIALMFCRASININSVIALVVLFGTSVNNAIILYESCATLRIVEKETIIATCRGKLRAIIMTTATTVLALIPFAIDPLNKNPQSSMAVAIIGGLFFSTGLVLLVIPKALHAVLIRRMHE